MTDEELRNRRAYETNELCRAVAARIADGILDGAIETGNVDPSDEQCCDYLLHALYMLSGRSSSHERLRFLRDWRE